MQYEAALDRFKLSDVTMIINSLVYIHPAIEDMTMISLIGCDVLALQSYELSLLFLFRITIVFLPNVYEKIGCCSTVIYSHQPWSEVRI